MPLLQEETDTWTSQSLNITSFNITSFKYNKDLLSLLNVVILYWVPVAQCDSDKHYDLS